MPWPGVPPITRSEGRGMNVGRTQCAYKAMPVGNTSSYKAITNLKERWLTEIADLVSGVPPTVPPLRLINHEINLINPTKCIHYRLPKCLDALKAELTEKISHYIGAGWWVPAMV